MVVVELLGQKPSPDFSSRELFAYFTTFSPAPLAFMGAFAGVRGRFLEGPTGEELAGGYSQTLAARLWLVPDAGNRFQIRQFQVQDGGEWVWLVRNSETMPHRIWNTVARGQFL